MKPDIVLKNFWEDNGRFADLFNTVLFGGEPVVSPEKLEVRDSDVSGVLRIQGREHSLGRIRDVVKKGFLGMEFAILGLESQLHTHYAMPLRSMLYDGLSYLEECRKLSRILKTETKEKANGRKISSDEFLSGMRKEDRIHPVVTLVVYYGEEEWDGPLSLRDMIVDMPEEIGKIFADYRMNLLQVRDSGSWRFQNEEVQAVFEISREIFGSRFDAIKKKYKDKYISPEVLTVIGTITGAKALVEQGQKGEADNVCRAIEELEKRCRKEGYDSGKREGYNSGKREGYDSGHFQCLKENIEKLYRKGFEIENISELLEIPRERVRELCGRSGL